MNKDFNFDEVIDRSNHNSAKYDELVKNFGRSDLIPMWIADMDFQVAKPIRDAIDEKNTHGIFGYVYRPESYFMSFVNWQKKRHNWDISEKLCAFNTSVVSAIYSSICLFSSDNANIMFLTPAYTQFFNIVKNAGRKAITSMLKEVNGTFEIDFEDFENKLKEKPEIFIMCNPHNPLGRVWKKEEIEKIDKLCQQYGVLVISDEIHSDLLLWGNKHTPYASVSDYAAQNTITCFSTTKTFNLAGLQASTTLYPNLDMKRISDEYWDKLEQSRNNCFSVVAMEAALNHGEEWLQELIYYIEKNMIFVKNFIDKHLPMIKFHIPESTYLMWLDFRALQMNDDDLWDFLINKAKLALSRGIYFGGEPGFMRMNVACPQSKIEDALFQLKAAVDSLEL